MIKLILMVFFSIDNLLKIKDGGYFEYTICIF